MSEFTRLREALLGREIDAIDALNEEVARLALQTNDPREIVSRLSPLIHTIVARNIDLKPHFLVETLAPIIAEVLSKQIRNSGEAMAEALAPIIAEAIRVQMRTQRNEMVDALYPVIGSSVAKYVSQAFKELLDTINARVQHTFSFATLRRKTLAIVKGIPESELLLRESIGWEVEAVFLIHKTSGLLMAERYADAFDVAEPEMVASMLTAIQSFVNEWIARNGEDAQIDQIEYGASKIYLEVAGASYIAVVLKGEPSQIFVQTVAEVLSGIVEAHTEVIRGYNGDRETLPLREIEQGLDTIFACHPEHPDTPTVSKWPLVLIGIFFAVLLLYGGYRFYAAAKDERASETLNRVFAQSPSLALYRVKAAVDDGHVRLTGAVPDPSLRHAAETMVRQRFTKAIIKNDMIVARPFEAAAIDKNTRQLQAMQKAFALSTIATRFYFGIGKAVLDISEREKLDFLHLLFRLNPNATLKLVGYSDLAGSQEQRMEIAIKRARAVRDALMGLGADGARIVVSASKTPPPDIETNKKVMDEARCVIATLIPDTNQKDGE